MAKLLLNADGKVLMDKGKVLKAPGKQESESVTYYRAMRNENYPYLPLPSEMTEEDDVIYMLYDANGYMCCPVIKIKFTNVTVTVQKYMNKTLISEYVDTDIVSNTNKYMEFSEEDEDYSTYNYILIKLQGAISSIDYKQTPKFKDESYNFNNVSNRRISNDLIEFSGKCNNCTIYNSNTSGFKISLQYFSFKNENTLSGQRMFYNHDALICIPELNITVSDTREMFWECSSLEKIANFKTSNLQSAKSTFYKCSKLTETPYVDTSLCTDVAQMYMGCTNLKYIPLLNIDNAKTTNRMFSGCEALKKVPILKAPLTKDIQEMFSSCYNIDEIPDLELPSNITNFGSFLYQMYRLRKINLKNIYYSLYLSNSYFLSHDELVKLLNNLATVETTQTLTLGSTLLAKLTDEEKAIATNKGWTLA